MFARLLLLFIVVPIAELALLIDIGGAIGLGPTLAIVIGTGFLGAYLAKKEGLRTYYNIQAKMQAGELPGDELLDGLMILVAGVVLLTPGIMTDVFGFLLLFRPTRQRFKLWLKNKFSKNMSVHIRGGTPPGGGPVDFT